MPSALRVLNPAQVERIYHKRLSQTIRQPMSMVAKSKTNPKETKPTTELRALGLSWTVAATLPINDSKVAGDGFVTEGSGSSVSTSPLTMASVRSIRPGGTGGLYMGPKATQQGIKRARKCL